MKYRIYYNTTPAATESPLAEGRELKYCNYFPLSLHPQSPLAEGRELKFVPIFSSAEEAVSPLAEGRELKYKY